MDADILNEYRRYTGHPAVTPWVLMLENRVPVMGKAMQRNAARQLVNLAAAGNLAAAWVIAYAVDAHSDEQVRSELAKGITKLKPGFVFSHIWTVWARARGKNLGQILSKKQPPEGSTQAVRALSLLFLQRMEALQTATPTMVEALVEYTRDDDEVIAARARFAIAHLTAAEAIARLCHLWARDRSPALLDTITQAGYQPDAPVQAAMLVALKMNRLDRVTYGHEKMVPHLLAACTDEDEEIAARARFCLLNLQQSDAINALCAIWASRREPRLEQVILQGGYVARQPARVRLLSALKLNRTEVANQISPDELSELLTAMKDKDLEIAARAAVAVHHLEQPGVRDRLCQMVIEQDMPELRKIALECGYLPEELPQRALFLFLTNQMQAYEVLDFDHRLLNAVYETSSQAIRQRIIRRIQQTGRQDFLTILTGADYRSRAERMTPIESQLIVQMLTANREWQRLWEMATQLTLEFAVEIIRVLAQNHWQPVDENDQLTFAILTRLAGEKLTLKPTDLERILPPAVPRASLKVHGRVNDLAFAPDSTLLAVGTGSRRVALWDYRHAKLVKTYQGFEHSIGNVVYSDIGCLCCAERSSSGACGIYLCDGEQPVRIGQHSQPVTALEAWQEGILLSSGRDSQVGLWDTAKRSLYHSTHVADWPRAVCLSTPRSRAALLTNSPLIISLPDLARPPQPNYRWPRGLNAERGMIRCASFLPESEDLLTGQLNGHLLLYQREPRPVLRSISRFPGPVAGIRAVPGHDLMAVAAADGELCFFALPELKSHLSVKAPVREKLISLHVSPDGAFMATGSSDSMMTLWDLRVLDIPALFARPLASAKPGQIPAVLALAGYPDLPDPLRATLTILGHLLQLRFRYDIQLSEIPTIQVGEFDVMIDE